MIEFLCFLVILNLVISRGNVNPIEISALFDLYNATDGQYWSWRNVSTYGPVWNFTVSDPNPCSPQWQGLECNCYFEQCVIVEIYLKNYGLKGTIPDSISNLASLYELTLSKNLLIGTIPDSIGNFTYLSILDLSGNALHQSIPDTFGNLRDLTTLNLCDNQLYGSLPEGIYNCTALNQLQLNNNRLQGTLSSAIGNLTVLRAANLNNNKFEGSIPISISSLRNIRRLELAANGFIGQIPDQICELQDLVMWTLYDNRLQSTIPNCIGNMSSLEYIDLGFNFITGTIPPSLVLLNRTLSFVYFDRNSLLDRIPANWLNESSQLVVLFLNDNDLTGSVPYFNLPLLVDLDIHSNFFTGIISDSLARSSDLHYFDVSYNEFEGSLFANFSQFKILRKFVVSFNCFTGEIPAISPNVFLANDNFFTGTISSALCFNSPSYVNVGSNRLHGIIPDCSFTSKFVSGQLLYFAANDNYFSGTIPTFLVNEWHLKALTIDSNVLTGVLLPLNSTRSLQYLYVQNNLLSGQIQLNSLYTKLGYVDVSNNQFSGTLPIDVFRSEVPLISFAAATNCLTGSIPAEICDSSSLVYLDLDGLATAQKCRDYIFPRWTIFKSFTLPNEISGGIPECLFNMSLLQTLQLGGNSIRWKFPSEISMGENLTSMTLSNNKLHGTIPLAIQHKQWQYLHMRFNKFTGWLEFTEQPENCTLKLEVNRLSGNIPSALFNLEAISILVGNLFSCFWNRHNLPIHDSNYRTYQCGSNSFYQSLLAWAVGVCTMVLILGFIWLDVLRLKYLPDITLYFSQLNSITNDGLARFHLELLKMRNAFITYSVVVCVVFTPVYGILSAYYGTVYDQYAWTVSAAFLSGITPGITLMALYIGVISYSFSLLYVPKDFLSASFFVSVGELQWNQFLKIFAVVFVNCLIMILVNGGYVYINLTYDLLTVFLARIGLVGFKLLWNDLAVKRLMMLIRPAKKNRVGDASALNDQNISREMFYMTFIILFNSIVAPCLASAIIDNNCLYNVFIAASPVQSEFPVFNVIEYCDDESRLSVSPRCHEKQISSYIDVTYDPPFIYSYQCTSSILTNYASVYVLMCMITVFAKPLSMYVMQLVHSRISKKTLLYKLINGTMYGMLKPASDTILQDRKVLFHKDRFALRMIFKIAILITFGVIFPPLAIVLCLAIVCELYLTLFIIGRYLALVGDAERHLHRELLCRDCEGCVNLLDKSLVKLVVPFAAFFYAFYVFDIYGDKVGYRHSIWASVLLAIFPAILWIGFTLNDVLTNRQRLTRSQNVSTTGSEMNAVSPMQKEYLQNGL